MASLNMNKVIVLALVVIVASQAALAQGSRQDPNAKPLANKPRINETCGTINDIAKKVEICAKPLMDILTGTIDKWPKNINDAMELCASFGVAEKCIRDVGRRCTKGLQKTIISTLASSVARARKRECTTAKFPLILRTTQCVEKNQVIVQSLMSNTTNKLVAIEEKISDLDRKTSAICCMINEIEVDTRNLLRPKCPAETDFVTKLYRTVLEDVIELICRAPKCNDVYKGLKITKTDDSRGIISTILRIVFSLG